jgi:hypothetical protein
MDSAMRTPNLLTFFFFSKLYICCMYKGWAMKSSPCTMTFNVLLCFCGYVAYIFCKLVWFTDDPLPGSASSSAHRGRLSWNLLCSPPPHTQATFTPESRGCFRFCGLPHQFIKLLDISCINYGPLFLDTQAPKHCSGLGQHPCMNLNVIGQQA